MTPELRRRDALAALAAAGIAVGGGAAALHWGDLDGGSGSDDGSGGTDDEDRGSGDGGRGFDERERETLVALADVLYPSAVSGIPEFVETYVVGRVAERPAYERGMRDALAELDERARTWHDDRFAALDRDTRDSVLREMSVHTADPDPDPDALVGSHVRYYLVNDLLFALYSTPTGGRLVGIENPQGFPGGTTSYQRGSERE